MKNLKVCWPTLLAIALAVSITSCHNNKIVEDYEKNKILESIPTFDEVFEPTQEVEEIIIPEGLQEEETTHFAK